MTLTTETSESVPAPKLTESDAQTTTQISLKLVKMNVKPRDRKQVTQEMLDCIPSSKYSKCTREYIDASNVPELPRKIVRKTIPIPRLYIRERSQTDQKREVNEENS